jgi:uncharacterized protein (DUF1697 family)
MATFVSLLRGINVSGQRLITMVDLKRSFKGLGFDDVQTHLQSGNVVFDAEQDDPQGYASSIRKRILSDFGHSIKVLVLRSEKMQKIAISNPFLSVVDVEAKWLYATFLFQSVSKAKFNELKLPAQKEEKAVLIDQVMFLSCPHGYGRTKLNNRFFERTLDVSATTRNWNTVSTLAKLCRRC